MEVYLCSANLARRSESASDADSVALIALACRRAGGEVWNEFRAASPEFIGNHPLPGDLVVLINRLSMPALKLVVKSN